MNEKIANVVDVNEDDFVENVIEASKTKLIIVDFWAPWCGPCKQISPVLEKIANEADGKILLVKINIDENQQIAAQLRIQSIPTIYAFKNGQPVDAFQGVLPEKKIIEFIEKHLDTKINEDHSEFYNKIDVLIENKKYEIAKNELESFIADNLNEYKSLALYINCLSELKEFDEANTFSESLSEDALKDQSIKSALKNLELKKNFKMDSNIDELKKQHLKKPDDIKIILKLSDQFFSENLHDEAFELLINNYNKNKEKIKNKILEYFEALGQDNNKTQEYRKRFSSIMFS